MSNHYGKMVENVVRKKGLSISKVALLVGVNRRSVYNWFNQQELRADIILRIGMSIHYDFSMDMPELLNSQGLSDTDHNDNFEFEATVYWKRKYILLRQEYSLLRFKAFEEQGLEKKVVVKP
jgi:predicted transcriptional regulator